jgi:hypothetical protein
MVTAANGETFSSRFLPIAVNGNKVMEADIDVSNGVIHIIDGVLFLSWVNNSITDRVVADSVDTLLALVGLARTWWCPRWTWRAHIGRSHRTPCRASGFHCSFTVQWEGHFDVDPSLPSSLV